MSASIAVMLQRWLEEEKTAIQTNKHADDAKDVSTEWGVLSAKRRKQLQSIIQRQLKDVTEKDEWTESSSGGADVPSRIEEKNLPLKKRRLRAEASTEHALVDHPYCTSVRPPSKKSKVSIDPQYAARVKLVSKHNVYSPPKTGNLVIDRLELEYWYNSNMTADRASFRCRYCRKEFNDRYSVYRHIVAARNQSASCKKSVFYGKRSTESQGPDFKQRLTEIRLKTKNDDF